MHGVDRDVGCGVHDRMPRKRLWGAVLLCALALSGCAKDTGYDAPAFPFAAGWRGAPASAPVLLSNADWWKKFRDPTLDTLTSRAITGNLTIAAARERISAARAALDAVPGAASAETSVSASLSGDPIDRPEALGDASLGLSWLLDPWGERRATLRAAAARVEAAQAERDAAQLLVIGTLANTYLDLRYQQRLLAIRRAELASRRETLAQTRALGEANAATRLDVLRAEARVAEIQSQLPSLSAAIEGRKAQIAVLAGVAPGALGVNLDKGGQPRPRMSAATGIPSDLLRNRPDIRIAERGYYATLADMDAAEAQLYPRLSLGGAITLNALEQGRSAATYAFGPTVVFPTLPGKSARAGVALRAARAREAHAVWTQTVLGAISEVEQALLDYSAVSASLGSAERAARLYGEAGGLAREVFSRGEATLSDLIDADTERARGQNALADAIYRQGLAFVALNVRLGAGNSAGP